MYPVMQRKGTTSLFPLRQTEKIELQGLPQFVSPPTQGVTNAKNDRYSGCVVRPPNLGEEMKGAKPKMCERVN